MSIPVQQGSALRLLAIAEFQALTGAAFIPQLDFETTRISQEIEAKTKKMHTKGGLPRDQLWNGFYYKNEIETLFFPKVAIRWIDRSMGWGVFATKEFKKGEFIAEYSGKVRKRKKIDKKNAYCFEYSLSPMISTSYLIDAQDQGGLGRFINHHDRPNLTSILVTLNWINHVLLITNQKIQEGSQLFFDYGPDYWSSRGLPRNS